jgi:hypothetical protein
MFCGLIFADTESVESHFHVLRSRTRFRRCRVRRVSFSCFACPDIVSAVSRACYSVFMFSAPGHVFRGAEGVGSRFHVLRSRTHFRWYLGCRVPFSGFARGDSFSAEPRASAPVFIFFHSKTRFRRYGGCRVPFSSFTRPDSFSSVSRTSGHVFMFCAPVLIFGGTAGIESRFHILRARTHFRRYRGRRSRFHIIRSRTCFRRCGGRRVLYSCFALLDTFSAVLRASGPVFMFARQNSFSLEPRVSAPVFMFFRSRTHFRRYGGCRVPFSYFARPDSFSAV